MKRKLKRILERRRHTPWRWIDGRGRERILFLQEAPVQIEPQAFEFVNEAGELQIVLSLTTPEIHPSAIIPRRISDVDDATNYYLWEMIDADGEKINIWSKFLPRIRADTSPEPFPDN